MSLPAQPLPMLLIEPHTPLHLVLSVCGAEGRHVGELLRDARGLACAERWRVGHGRHFEEHLITLRAAGLARRCGDHWRLSEAGAAEQRALGAWRAAPPPRTLEVSYA